jgi:hypothetical protein
MAIPIPSRAAGRTVPDAAGIEAARAALLASLDSVPIYQLSVEVETVSPVELSLYPGSALRGALVQALLDTHCTNKAAPSCAVCPLVRACPVSALVAPMRDEAPRGRDVPRPFAITPPVLGSGRLEPGSRWSFGLTLFGSAAALFPYVVLSRPRLEANGLGLRDEAGRRGRVAVRGITSLVAAGETTIYSSSAARIAAPAPSDVRARIAARAASLPSDELTLRFTTPMRLVADGAVQRDVQPAVLAHRILERWEAIRREYAAPGITDPLAPLRGPAPDGAIGDPRLLLAAADGVRVLRDATRWVELASWSSRQRHFTPIGGLIGDLAVTGPLAALRGVLVLGELIHAGKDVVKGNGCYTILAPSSEGAARPWN